MSTTTVSSVTDKFFQGDESVHAAAPSYLRAVQKEALSVFEKEGFPTTKHEEWKYTNLAPLTARSLDPHSVHPLTVEIGRAHV